jgi:hypothetical protein
MRLTALANSPVTLELFIFADRQVEAEGLITEICDTLKALRAHISPPPYLPSVFRSPTFGFKLGVEIGHPDMEAIAWNGCCLTKLSGILHPDEMKADIQLHWQTPTRYRQQFHSHRGAFTAGLAWAILAWTIALPIGFCIACGLASQERRRRVCATYVVCPLLLACAAVTFGVYLSLPKTSVNSFDSDRAYARMQDFNGYDVAMRIAAAVHPATEMSLAAFRTAFAIYVRQNHVINYMTGTPAVEEDSPGNYAVLEEPRQFTVRWYDEAMYGRDLEVPRRQP